MLRELAGRCRNHWRPCAQPTSRASVQLDVSGTARGVVGSRAYALPCVERRGLPLQFALDLMLMPVLFVSAPQLWLQRAETIVSTATNFGFAPVASRASDADADDILAPTRTLESSSLSVKQRAGPPSTAIARGRLFVLICASALLCWTQVAEDHPGWRCFAASHSCQRVATARCCRRQPSSSGRHRVGSCRGHDCGAATARYSQRRPIALHGTGAPRFQRVRFRVPH